MLGPDLPDFDVADRISWDAIAILSVGTGSDGAGRFVLSPVLDSEVKNT